MIQALNGAGDTRTPTIINLACFWFFQIPLAYLLAKGLIWARQVRLFLFLLLKQLLQLLLILFSKKGNGRK